LYITDKTICYNFSGSTKYLYANGDPMNGIDPTGRFDEIEFAAKVAQVVTIIAAVTTGASLAYCLYKEAKALNDVLSGGSVPENMAQDIGNCIIAFLKNLMSPVPSIK